jgi:hypothetical protein
MISAAELAIQRRLTAEFIKADQISVVLRRAEWTADGAGGQVKGNEEPLAPQTMRLIPLGDGATPRMTMNGEAVTPSYMLMGTYLADVQRWDTFTVNGRTYEVVFINENQQYEIKAEVAYRDGI